MIRFIPSKNTKFRFNLRTWIILSFLIVGVLFIWGINYTVTKPILSEELEDLEIKAEKGDTSALHKLLRFYEENSDDDLEVVEVVDENGNAIKDDEESKVSYNNPLKENYLERLYYWLNKGLALNDPVAKRMTGIKLYYMGEAESIKFLGEAAEQGDRRAALFCGSACFNQGKNDEAFKYLNMAYELGEPSAGWHLAMCYVHGVGTEANKQKAIEVLRHSAFLNYPEAVIEMKRIEPENPLWKNKQDSLGIDLEEFVIIE